MSRCRPPTAAQLPSAPRDLTVDIVGAGRVRGLEEWIEETWTTSLLVLDGGSVVHEWYADGLGAGHVVPGRLDDQVGARAPGRARGP